jgi:hypothetical protein
MIGQGRKLEKVRRPRDRGRLTMSDTLPQRLVGRFWKQTDLKNLPSSGRFSIWVVASYVCYR